MSQQVPNALALCRVCRGPLGSKPYRLVNVVACVHHGPIIKHPCAKTRRHVPFGGVRVHDGCEARYLGCGHLIVSPAYAHETLADVFGRVEWAPSRIASHKAEAVCSQ